MVSGEHAAKNLVLRNDLLIFMRFTQDRGNENEDHSSYTFKTTKEELIPYLVEMNYTHVEFMPVMAHPLGLSWGYQLMGYFALEQTYGSPEEFQDFVEECHLNNIGVIVDWVPGHFIINDDALAYYDGTPTFEYQDEHRAITMDGEP